MLSACGGIARSFLFNKPPMVVFMLCLLAFAITTLSLSFYVSQADKIENPDVLGWNSLLQRISNLDFCLQPLNSTSYKPHIDPNFEFSSISVPITQKFIEEFRLKTVGSGSKDLVVAQGEVRVDQLGRHLSRYEGQKIFLAMEIARENKVGEICLIVYASKHLLEDLNSGEKPLNCSRSEDLNAQNLALAAMSSDEHFPLNWCDPVGRNETPMVLEFEQNRDWSVLVSTSDKEMMQLHLMITSAFLFAILLGFVVGATIRVVASVCRGGSHMYSVASSVDQYSVPQSLSTADRG